MYNHLRGNKSVLRLKSFLEPTMLSTEVAKQQGNRYDVKLEDKNRALFGILTRIYRI